MSAQEFVLGASQTLKLNAERAATAPIRFGKAWLTQHHGPKDHALKTGHAMPLKGGAAAMITAYEPTLLEIYRRDPVAVRWAIEDQAHHARGEAMRACFARLFR
jgi:hypothetical protein